MKSVEILAPLFNNILADTPAPIIIRAVGAVTVRLGGPTCLSGDVIGDYSFQKPLAYGDLLMFGDMAIYTTCKNNTFNGMPLPDIWLRHGDKTMERLTDFGYEDFKGRLGHRR